MIKKKSIGFKFAWLVFILEFFAMVIILVASIGIHNFSITLSQIQNSSAETNNAYLEFSKSLQNFSNLFILLFIFTLLISLLVAVFSIKRIIKPVKTSIKSLLHTSNELKTMSQEFGIQNNSSLPESQGEFQTTDFSKLNLDELSSIVKNTLENTKEASSLAKIANDSSSSGLEKLDEMVQSMEDISKSTDEINAIIDVIEDIAFQTNMLALNAAVEAARAGEAGLGFAVVADEVKNLANRSEGSAKESTQMIKEMLQNVSKARLITTELAQMFKAISEQNKKVLEINNEIESSSILQNKSIDQASSSIVELNSLVQKNTLEVEKRDLASEKIQTQSNAILKISSTLTKHILGDESKVKEKKAQSPKQKTIETKRIEKKKVTEKPIERKPVATKHIEKKPVEPKALPPKPSTTTKNDTQKKIKPIIKPEVKLEKKPVIKAEVKPEKKPVVKPDSIKQKHIISFEDDEDYKPE